MMKDFFSRFVRIFKTETLTIDELRELNLYAKLQREFANLQTEFNELNAEYTELKQALFSPLYVPNTVDKGQMMYYILLGIMSVNLILTFMKK